MSDWKRRESSLKTETVTCKPVMLAELALATEVERTQSQKRMPYGVVSQRWGCNLPYKRSVCFHRSPHLDEGRSRSLLEQGGSVLLAAIAHRVRDDVVLVSYWSSALELENFDRGCEL